MTIAIFIVAWFSFGFIVAAIVLFGPMHRRASRMRKEATEAYQKAVKMAKEHGDVLKDHTDLLKKYGDALQAQLETEKECNRRYEELQDEYIKCLEDCVELREGRSGVEGTS